MSDSYVLVPAALAIVLFFTFLSWELCVAAEPILPAFLLLRRVPLLVGLSDFLVALSNFAVAYFFPMWFQVVMLKSASEAGLHLLPNSVSMSMGSIFAGWVMYRLAKFKKLDIISGLLPIVSTFLIATIRMDSSPFILWCSIIPLGFGNAAVLQTMLIALLAHIPADAMAVGTGFVQLFRGLGQVGGVGITSAIFQHYLDVELRARITGPDAETLIEDIRHSATLVLRLPAEQQAEARAAYDVALHAVFFSAFACSLLGFVVRFFVPEKDLDDRPPSPPESSPASSSASIHDDTSSESGSSTECPSPSTSESTLLQSDDEESLKHPRSRRSA